MDFESELLTVLSLDEKDKYITFTRFFCGVVMNSISGFLPIRTVPVLGLVLHVLLLGLELRTVAWRMKGEIINYLTRARRYTSTGGIQKCAGIETMIHYESLMNVI
jgi:hypothetical protein